MTLPAEVSILMVQPAPRGHLSLTWARAIAYLGALGFIVFVQTYIQWRRREATSHARQT